MDTSDEVDIFALSYDEETSAEYDVEKAGTSSASKSKSKSKCKTRNPVKEQLLKQLNEVEERVERTKRQINDTKLLKEKILRKFSSRHFYGESSSSSSESDLCTTSGEPIVKRRRRSKRPRKQPLVVKGSWQHVTDDKWIVGVVLRNTIEEDLEELDIHVRIKEVDNFNGISSFWTKDAKSFWRRTDLAKPGSSGEVAATVVLDLPKFSTNSNAEIMGVVSYKLDSERQLQTLIPTIVLTIENIISNKHDLNISWESSSKDSSALDAKVQSILSVKSLAVEKITEFKTTQSFTKEIKLIFDEIGLREIFPKVFAGKNGPLDRCMIELGSASATKYRSVIYSRSIPQLNMLLQLLHNAFPKGTSVTCRNVTAEGVIQAFQTELESYLTTRNTFELQKAVVNTDLISKEFEDGCTIYRAE